MSKWFQKKDLIKANINKMRKKARWVAVSPVTNVFEIVVNVVSQHVQSKIFVFVHHGHAFV